MQHQIVLKMGTAATQSKSYTPFIKACPAIYVLNTDRIACTEPTDETGNGFGRAHVETALRQCVVM